ncbi:MAG: glycoside hydrolase family 2 protein [Promethearchaeota archaeon]
MDIYLDGDWAMIADKTNSGVTEQWYMPEWIKDHLDLIEPIEIPSNFNTMEGLENYVGVVWHFKKLPEIPYRPKSHEFSIEFEAVNYHTEVWLNGQYLGEHKGDFLPFRFVFNPRLISLTGVNYLSVKVSNEFDRSGIPSDIYDWHNWGGIHRSVKILILENTRVTKIKVTTEIPDLAADSSIINVDFTIKKPQEFLDRCYAMEIEPEVEWELYYLGRFFDGETQFNKVLLQTGIQDVNQYTLPKLAHVDHNKDALKAYFAPVFDKMEKYEEPIDLETFFSQYLQSTKGSSTQRRNLYDEIDDADTKDTIEAIEAIDDIDNIEEIDEESEDDELNSSIRIGLHSPSLWSPESPELYSIKIHLNGIDEDKEVRFGVRQIEARGPYLYLNNKPIRLRGSSMHEERMPYGRHYPNELRRKEIIKMKALGFNALRTGHYPHDEKLLHYADEEGLLILEEIPLYWNCDFRNPETLKIASSMFHTLIKRDFNHPSVILWSVANEIPTLDHACYTAVKRLIQLAKRWDPSRLVSYASSHFTIDPLRKYCDVVCINLYLGWYYASVYQLNLLLDIMYWTKPQSPWILTEFGAGAHSIISRRLKTGKKGEISGNNISKLKNSEISIGKISEISKDSKENKKSRRGRINKKKYSDSLQSRIIAYTIQVVNSKPYMGGWFIWNFRDFKSPLRKNKYQRGFNRKGLFDELNEPKEIVKILPRIVDKKLPEKPLHRASAIYLRYVLKLFELGYLLILRLLSGSQRRRIRKSYSYG